MGIVGLGANAGIIGHSLPSILVREALDPGPERLFEGRLIEAAGFAKDDREASQPRWIGLVGAGPAPKFAVELQVVSSTRQIACLDHEQNAVRESPLRAAARQIEDDDEGLTETTGA